jgi:osmotically inducible protein OsmC
MDPDRFAALAATAERTCPVSRALAGTKITMDAALS